MTAGNVENILHLVWFNVTKERLSRVLAWSVSLCWLWVSVYLQLIHSFILTYSVVAKKFHVKLQLANFVLEGNYSQPTSSISQSQLLESNEACKHLFLCNAKCAHTHHFHEIRSLLIKNDFSSNRGMWQNSTGSLSWSTDGGLEINTFFDLVVVLILSRLPPDLLTAPRMLCCTF